MLKCQRRDQQRLGLVLHTQKLCIPRSARGVLERRKLQSWSAMAVRAALELRAAPEQRGRRLQYHLIFGSYPKCGKSPQLSA